MTSSQHFFKFTLCLSIYLLALTSCQKSSNSPVDDEPKLFTTVSPEHSGLDFSNQLEETLESNYYQYLYTYIGGGVAAGDINNDGLIDLYFTSNVAADKLYLNKGNPEVNSEQALVFEDITQAAGIQINDGFNAGVAMADVNADGFLDIYVSRGGWRNEEKFSNLLYINNGDLTFSEKAAEFGLDDNNRGIQATFFDYDHDNDLDVYLSNTPNVTGRSTVEDLRAVEKDPESLKLKGSDRFYENDGKGHFTDVSEQVGLVYDIGFGLNPQVTDLNGDGWLDVYVCNDFNYPDLVYVNNEGKGFTESREQLFKHMSFSSMGSDAADINNDGLPDLMTLDMNPEDYIRSKTTMSMTSVQRFEAMVKNGYHYQYMHNMLQLNNGNGSFSEIANMAGIANTDWSWALLSADFDLDGWNDLYITNGVYRDVMDQDKNIEIRNILRQNARKPTSEDLLQFTQMLPQQKLRNYFFKNQSDLTFKDVSNTWASENPTFSNGATYADLDNDGDLDVVINNINDPVTLLKNNAVENQSGHFLKIKLRGTAGNPDGVGAKVKLFFADGSSQVREYMPVRGYLSSVSNQVHFGFNNATLARLEITWPDGTFQEVPTVAADQQIEVSYQQNGMKKQEVEVETLFADMGSVHEHKDPYFNDYGVQILLPHKLSQTGPFAATADVNGDGLTDVYIGGGHRQAGQLLLGNQNGSFDKTEMEAFAKDAFYEDQDVLFFDADNDGDQDLYVVSGSYEFLQTPRALQDRLYINNNGKFENEETRLPFMVSSGSVVVGADFDQDGDTDLFVGGRVVPGKYPYPPKSYFLQNDKGRFSNVINEIAPGLANIGMVTDAAWADLDKDGAVDLIVMGEWMGIEVFINKNGKLSKSAAHASLSKTTGWWNKLLVADVDGDGDNDIVAGNLGLNSKFHASPEKPFRIYTKDFDSNGIEDIVLAKEYKGREVPVRGKTCMTQQMPELAERVKTYNEFANSDLEQLVGTDLSQTLHYEVVEFRSGIFINQGGSFSFQPLAPTAQISPINSIVFDDLDGDGMADLLVAGNNYQPEVETTRCDAGISTFFKGNGKGGFELIPNLSTDLFLDKDIRGLEMIEMGSTKMLIVINNNGPHGLFKIHR